MKPNQLTVVTLNSVQNTDVEALYQEVMQRTSDYSDGIMQLSVNYRHNDIQVGVDETTGTDPSSPSNGQHYYFLNWDQIVALFTNNDSVMRQTIYNPAAYTQNPFYSSAKQTGINTPQHSQVQHPTVWVESLHELCHGWFSYFGIPDRTHEILYMKPTPDSQITAEQAFPIIFQYFYPYWNNLLNVNYQGTIKQLYPTGSIQGQCGDFAHKLVKFGSVGDTLAQKTAFVKLHGIPVGSLGGDFRAGDILITSESLANGHVAFINCVVPGGLQLSESNFNLNEKVNHSRVLSSASPKIIGVVRGKLLFKIMQQMYFVHLAGTQQYGYVVVTRFTTTYVPVDDPGDLERIARENAIDIFEIDGHTIAYNKARDIVLPLPV